MSVASSVPSEEFTDDYDESDYSNSFSTEDASKNLNVPSPTSRHDNDNGDDAADDSYSYHDDDFEESESRTSADASPAMPIPNASVAQSDDEYSDESFEALIDEQSPPQQPLPPMAFESNAGEDPIKLAVVKRLAELEHKNVSLGSELRIRQQELNSIAAINWQSLSRKKKRALERRQAHEEEMHRLQSSVDRLTKQLEESQSTVTRLRGELAEQHALNEQQLAKNAVQSEKHERLESELAAAHDKVQSLQQSIQRIEREADEKIRSAQNECDRTTASMRETLRTKHMELEATRGTILQDCMQVAKEESKRLDALKLSLDKQVSFGLSASPE
jgi:hypothetical protein